MKNEKNPLHFMENNKLFREVMDAKKANIRREHEEQNKIFHESIKRKSILLRENEEKKT